MSYKTRRELEKYYNERVVFHLQKNWDRAAHKLATAETVKKIKESKEKE